VVFAGRASHDRTAFGASPRKDGRTRLRLPQHSHVFCARTCDRTAIGASPRRIENWRHSLLGFLRATYRSGKPRPHCAGGKPKKRQSHPTIKHCDFSSSRSIIEPRIKFTKPCSKENRTIGGPTPIFLKVSKTLLIEKRPDLIIAIRTIPWMSKR